MVEDIETNSLWRPEFTARKVKMEVQVVCDAEL